MRPMVINSTTLYTVEKIKKKKLFALYRIYYLSPLSLSQKDLIILKDVHRAFAVDALASSHPLSLKEEDIIKPEQITEQFDTVSYSKVLYVW